jgi:hypothetical protein
MQTRMSATLGAPAKVARAALRAARGVYLVAPLLCRPLLVSPWRARLESAQATQVVYRVVLPALQRTAATSASRQPAARARGRSTARRASAPASLRRADVLKRWTQSSHTVAQAGHWRRHSHRGRHRARVAAVCHGAARALGGHAGHAGQGGLQRTAAALPKFWKRGALR